jgi:hypothetical protein
MLEVLMFERFMLSISVDAAVTVSCRYGGGKTGMSDTLVGGLWVADALFAFARAGAKGFHLHCEFPLRRC